MAIASPESSFPLIAFLHADLVKSIPKADLSKNCGLVQLIEGFDN